MPHNYRDSLSMSGSGQVKRHCGINKMGNSTVSGIRNVEPGRKMNVIPMVISMASRLITSPTRKRYSLFYSKWTFVVFAFLARMYRTISITINGKNITKGVVIIQDKL